MKSLKKLFVALVAVVFAVSVYAANASPAGNWKWTAQGPNGAMEMSAKFELKEGKVTGAVTSPRGETSISDGTYKDGNLAFKTERTFEDTKVVVKYVGKLEGDTIKGAIELAFGDNEPMKMDWNATRTK